MINIFNANIKYEYTIFMYSEPCAFLVRTLFVTILNTK